jgi:hypothetical protein
MMKMTNSTNQLFAIWLKPMELVNTNPPPKAGGNSIRKFGRAKRL